MNVTIDLASSTEAIRTRDVFHEWKTITSTLCRSPHGRMSPGRKWKRSTPLFQGVFGALPTSAGTWK